MKFHHHDMSTIQTILLNQNGQEGRDGDKKVMKTHLDHGEFLASPIQKDVENEVKVDKDDLEGEEDLLVVKEKLDQVKVAEEIKKLDLCQMISCDNLWTVMSVAQYNVPEAKALKGRLQLL